MPSKDEDLAFYNLGQVYGSIVHLHVLGQSFIVLNDYNTAVELLEKRGSNYSSRPRFPLCEIAGYERILVFMKYGDEFRLHRRMLQKYLAKDKVDVHRPVQTREARLLAINLTSDPTKYEHSFMRFATAVIIEVAYGHQIKKDDDPYLTIADEVCHIVTPAVSPSEDSLVNLFPFLQYFPSWFPGTHHATVAKAARPIVQRLYEYPFFDVKKKLAEGNARPSFLTSQMEELERGEGDPNVTIEDIQGASAILYVAGAETTSSTLQIFLLALLLYPEFQKRAQEEIDLVVGDERLPELSDRPSLPFLESLIQESQRWRPTVPLGVPHYSMEDDVYEGMFIPKKSIVIANARGMALDKNVYADPFTFDPTRFLPQPLGRGEPYPSSNFGFGRRVCPGRHFAEESVWLAVATILATLTVSKAIGDDGKEIEPSGSFTLSVTNRPDRFQCRIEPRNERAKRLLNQVQLEADKK